MEVNNRYDQLLQYIREYGVEETIKWSAVRVSQGNHYYLSDCFKFKIIIRYDVDKNKFFSLEINEKTTITPFHFLEAVKQAAEIIKKKNETTRKSEQQS